MSDRRCVSGPDSARAVTIHLSSRAITRSPSGCAITSKTRQDRRMCMTLASGWSEMRWHRWLAPDGIQWTADVIDTSDLTPAEVAIRASAWIRNVLDAA